MSEYIDREKFIELLVNRDLREISTKTIGECLDKAKVADVVKVVRCKDCKHCEKRRTANYQPFFYCLMQECSIKDDDYCSYGERKDGEE